MNEEKAVTSPKKSKRMSDSIALMIVVVSCICIGIMFLIANGNMTNAMEQTAENNILTSLNAKTQIINEYITNAETTLYAFSQSGELLDCVENPTDAGKQEIAQRYTMDYYNAIGNWEGIYLSSWASEVLTHPAPPVIGRVLREGDSLTALQNAMLAAPNGIYNTGIMASPASGELVISLYAPMYDGEEVVGYVGGATLAAGLKTLLDESVTEGLEKAEYSLINMETGVYIFDSNEELINTEVQNENLLKIMEQAKGGKASDTVEYSENGVKYFSVYKVLQDRGWMLLIRDNSSEIFASINSGRVALGLVCLLAVILISVFAWVIIRIRMQPVQVALDSIEQLKNLNLEHNEKIAAYTKKSDEIGSIAQAVESLTDTLRGIVKIMDDCSVSLEGSSASMNSTSGELMEKIENEAATTQQLSASIINTNEAISHVSVEIGKMKEMAESIKESVIESNESSEDLMKSSKDMASTAKSTAKSSNERILVTKQKIEEAIDDLQSLNKINDMANQILDITSQTNLLSLNASIEAARAGEAGRGFAVVADEIGKLANSSSETVAQIQVLCKDAEDSIERVKECFAEITDFLESDIAKQFEEFADMSGKYNDVVAGIKNSIDTIDESTSLFVKSVANISEQVENVNCASADNEAGVEELIKGNNETTMMVDNVLASAEENMNNAKSLKEIIDRFSV